MIETQEGTGLEENSFLKFGKNIMSKIGKQPVIIPSGVTVSEKDGSLEVKGKNGNLTVKMLKGVKVEIKDNEIVFVPTVKDKQTISNWGTVRALTANAVQGATEDFVKELVIEGVGFKAEVKATDLVLNVGFSHPVSFAIPEGVKIVVSKELVTLSGANKEVVGETAAKIRGIKKPEPYKGKGIRYKDEVIRRKDGKKATASA